MMKYQLQMRESLETPWCDLTKPTISEQEVAIRLAYAFGCFIIRMMKIMTEEDARKLFTQLARVIDSEGKEVQFLIGPDEPTGKTTFH